LLKKKREERIKKKETVGIKKETVIGNSQRKLTNVANKNHGSSSAINSALVTIVFRTLKFILPE
jgi:hypothetical protein